MEGKAGSDCSGIVTVRIGLFLAVFSLLHSFSKHSNRPENFPCLLSHRISASDFHRILELEKQELIRDVRKPEEFADGRIHGAVNVSRNDIVHDTLPYICISAPQNIH